MKRAVVMAEGRLITAEDLDLANSVDKIESLDLRAEIEKLERSLVQKALAISEGNVSKAAKLLCVSRPHLYNLMKSSGIHLSDEKVGE